MSLLLVRDCRNAAALRAAILSQTPTPIDAAFIDASLIPSLDVVHVAAGMVCQGPIKSKTRHSELVYTLHGTRHIGRALSTFGIKDDSRDVLVARFDATEDEMRALKALVEGTVVEGKDAIERALRDDVCNVSLVRRQYKVTEEELQVGDLVESVMCRIAARDCTATQA